MPNFTGAGVMEAAREGPRPTVIEPMACAGEREGADSRGPLGRGRGDATQASGVERSVRGNERGCGRAPRVVMGQGWAEGERVARAREGEGL